MAAKQPKWQGLLRGEDPKDELWVYGEYHMPENIHAGHWIMDEDNGDWEEVDGDTVRRFDGEYEEKQ